VVKISPLSKKRSEAGPTRRIPAPSNHTINSVPISPNDIMRKRGALLGLKPSRYHYHIDINVRYASLLLTQQHAARAGRLSPLRASTIKKKPERPKRFNRQRQC